MIIMIYLQSLLLVLDKSLMQVSVVSYVLFVFKPYPYGPQYHYQENALYVYSLV